jgi:pyruvate/2-oxoglutarate dehydrogenase complex dihydrolipoamide acyltransferase (E2) component
MSTVEFRLPDVGEGIHEAEIVKWLVQEGERVQEFDPIVEIQTDKALVELPAPTSGYIGEIVAMPGTIARVGDVLVRIHKSREDAVKRGRASAQSPAAAQAGQAAQAEQAAQARQEAQVKVAAAASQRSVEVAGHGSESHDRAWDTAGRERGTADPERGAAGLQSETSGREIGIHRPLATPGIRHYARQLGVPLAEVTGTGPRGRITKQDVERYLHDKRFASMNAPSDSLLWRMAQRSELAKSADGAASGASRVPELPEGMAKVPIRIPFRGVRRATAEHVKRSAFTAPHVTAFDECDATELVKLREQWNRLLEREGRRVTYLPFLVKATVSALKAFPYFNARLDEQAQEIELLPEYHIGIAVDSADGLFVPVIRNADQLSMKEIAAEIQRLTQGVKNRSLAQEELRGSTFTITNMGPIGGLFATPILNYPEVGILAVHQIQRKPVAREEQVVIRDVLTLSLSFDHRVIDGATSVRFLNHLKHLIENPQALMLELR